MITIALLLGFNSLAANLWVTAQQNLFPSLFPNDPEDFATILGAHWTYEAIGIFLVVLALTAALFACSGTASSGCRCGPWPATAIAHSSASASGCWPRSWGLAIALAAVGGIVVAGRAGIVTIGMMFKVFIFASAAATVGGFDSLGGAVIGGLGLGVTKTMVAGYQPEWIGDSMALGVAFILIFVVLLFKPTGLCGTAKVERV